MSVHDPTPPAESLVDLLLARAAEAPSDPACTFLDAEGEPSASLTWAGLHLRAGAVAALVASRCRPGDRVVLAYPAGLEFVPAFLGVMLAGALGVPAPPPDPRRPGRGADRLAGIVRDARPALILTGGRAMRETIERALDGIGAGLPPIATTSGLEDPARPPPPAPAQPVAYLQYTSGSTRTPRGVAVGHDNVTAQCRFLERTAGIGRDSVSLTWVPLHHDQGLFYGVCEPLFGGHHGLLMDPLDFAADPRRWLAAIGRHAVTHSGGPNFAYALCVRRIPPARREGLDLRSWRMANCGGEPVRLETLEAFAEAFRPHGFDRRAIQPAYGQAEATLRIAAARLGAGPSAVTLRAQAIAERRVEPAPPGADGVSVVSHGPLDDPAREVRIVDPETRAPLPADRVGEIWVRGPIVAHGYFEGAGGGPRRGSTGEREAEQAEVFGARSADGEGGWLRTGDLGFVHAGEIYLTGRLRDLIVVRGRNLYPQDLEATVEACDARLRPGCSAAFPVPGEGEERVGVAADLRPAPPDAPAPDPLEEAVALARLRRGIAAAVRAGHDVEVHGVALLPPGGVPKTSSGKLRRGACRDAYLRGGLARAPLADLEPGSALGLAPGWRFRVAPAGSPGEGRAVARPRRLRLLDRGREWRIDLERDGEHHRLDLPRFLREIAPFLDPTDGIEAALAVSRSPEELAHGLRAIGGWVQAGVLAAGPPAPLPYPDPEPGITAFRRDATTDAFVIFTGLRGRMYLPVPEFLARSRLLDRSVVVLHDHLGEHYRRGVSLHHPSFHALMDHLRALLDALPGPGRRFAIGTSIGAWPALAAAHALGLDAAWAFGLPRTRLRLPGPGGEREADLARWLHAGNGRTEYHLYFNRGHAPDARASARLAGLPGVVLHPCGQSHHLVLRTLWREGRLGDLFPPPPAGSAPAAGPRPGGHRADRATALAAILALAGARAGARVDPETPLEGLLDSIATLELLHDLERTLGRPVDYRGLESRDLADANALADFVAGVPAAPGARGG